MTRVDWRRLADRLPPSKTARRAGWFSLLGWAVFVGVQMLLAVGGIPRQGYTLVEWQQYFLRELDGVFSEAGFLVMFAIPPLVVVLARGGYHRRLYDAVVVTALVSAVVAIPHEVTSEISDAVETGAPIVPMELVMEVLDDGLLFGIAGGVFFALRIGIPFVIALWLGHRYWPGAIEPSPEPSDDRGDDDVTLVPDGGAVGELMETQPDRLSRIQRDVANVNRSAATAVANAAELSRALVLTSHLEDVHGALLDTYQETVSVISTVEHALDDADGYARGPTPRQLTSDHADRLREQYSGPVLTIALQLLEYNRRKWLHGSPETVGAEAVERHGLTESQRSWLNDLSDAWREYDDGE